MIDTIFTPIKRIPFFLITGFLGSGKTTLLKNIINQFANDKKLAIIQNEFAAANIDKKELKDTDKSFKLLEINRGSVFCVCLLSSFTKSLREFIDAHQPEAIFLEATGLSDPIAVAEILNDARFDDVYLSHVWCIADAVNFHKSGSMITRVQHQVRIADTVVINKIDLNSETQEIRTIIKELNPFCEIVETQNSNIKLPDIFGFNISVAEKRKNENALLESLDKPEINAVVLRTGKKIKPNRLEQFLSEFGEKTIRLKGYVVLENGKAIAVQSCFGDYQLSDIKNYNAPTELIAMGENISAKDLKDAYESKCSF